MYSPLVQLQQRLCLPRFALCLRLHRLLVLAKHPLKLLVRPILEEVCSDGRRHCTRIGASWSRVSSRTANLEEWRECAARGAGEAAPPWEAAGCPQSCQPCGLKGGEGGRWPHWTGEDGVVGGPRQPTAEWCNPHSGVTR